MEVEEAPEGPEASNLPEEGLRSREDVRGCGPASGGDESPAESDPTADGGFAPALLAEEAGSGTGAWPPRGFPCSLCKRLFSSLEHLREHEYRHTLSLMALSLDWPGARGRPAPPRHQPRPQPLHCRQALCRPAAEPAPERYLCSQCPASFTLKSNADRHEKTIHYKKKLMQCAYCLKHFRDRTDLHRHLSSVHSRERGYACPACAKAFSTQKNLATHVKVCCQLGPGDLLGGGAGTGMSRGGAMDSLWRLSQEMKVDRHNLAINAEDRYGLTCSDATG